MPLLDNAVFTVLTALLVLAATGAAVIGPVYLLLR